MIQSAESEPANRGGSPHAFVSTWFSVIFGRLGEMREAKTLQVAGEGAPIFYTRHAYHFPACIIVWRFTAIAAGIAIEF